MMLSTPRLLVLVSCVFAQHLLLFLHEFLHVQERIVYFLLSDYTDSGEDLADMLTKGAKLVSASALGREVLELE